MTFLFITKGLVILLYLGYLKTKPLSHEKTTHCIISAFSIQGYGRGFEISVKGGIQTALVANQTEETGVGYSFAAEGKYIITKRWFAGISMGMTKLQERVTYTQEDLNAHVNPMNLNV